MCKIVKLLWQLFYAIGQKFLVVKGQILQEILAIWSHCQQEFLDSVSPSFPFVIVVVVVVVGNTIKMSLHLKEKTTTQECKKLDKKYYAQLQLGVFTIWGQYCKSFLSSFWINKSCQFCNNQGTKLICSLTNLSLKKWHQCRFI